MKKYYSIIIFISSFLTPFQHITLVISNLIAGLLAYSFLPKKPSLKFETISTHGQLAIL